MNVSHLFKDTVTIALCTGVSEAGDPTFGSQSTIKARVEHGSKVVPGPGGEELTAEHWFTTATALTQDDRVWLPGDTTTDNDQARRPIHVKKATELLGGNTYYEVYL